MILKNDEILLHGKKRNRLNIIPEEIIISKIYYIREQKVMLDTDLANLYQIETRVLKQAVRRNSDRFPDDFMFELTHEENQLLRTQLGDLLRGQHSKYLPFVFTEQVVAMLSSILNSESAIKVNIQIMRIFTRVRQMLADNTKLRLDIEKIKNKVDNQDKNIELVFRYLDELLEKQEKPQPSRKRISYKPDAEI